MLEKELKKRSLPLKGQIIVILLYLWLLYGKGKFQTSLFSQVGHTCINTMYLSHLYSLETL